MLKIVGDINFSDGFFDTGFGVGTSISSGKNPFFKLNRKAEDFWIGNFECVCSNTSCHSGIHSTQFRISPKSMDAVEHLNLYGVANNHVMQHGPEAFNQMINYLKIKGILYAVSLKKLFRDLYIFRTHTDFWQDHSIESIPAEFFRNSYLLKDSYFVESDEENLSKPRDKILQLLGSCDDMRIIMPIFLEDYLERIIENLERGNDLILITNDLVLNSLKNSQYYEKLIKFSKKEQLTIKKVEDDLQIFLTICENGMALNLFFNDGLFDNSCVILNDCADGLLWANQLFDFYLKKSIKII